MSESTIDKLRRLDREATRPWAASRHDPLTINGPDAARLLVEPGEVDEHRRQLLVDAELITSMRNALPDLLALVEAAQEIDHEPGALQRTTVLATLRAALARLTAKVVRCGNVEVRSLDGGGWRCELRVVEGRYGADGISRDEISRLMACLQALGIEPTGEVEHE